MPALSEAGSIGNGQVAGASSPARPAEELRPLIVASEDLLQGRRELWIEHRGELYRLRVTSAGKLYMTK
jgi:hemin uptake protein HemP